MMMEIREEKTGLGEEWPLGYDSEGEMLHAVRICPLLLPQALEGDFTQQGQGCFSS